MALDFRELLLNLTGVDAALYSSSALSWTSSNPIIELPITLVAKFCFVINNF